MQLAWSYLRFAEILTVSNEVKSIERQTTESRAIRLSIKHMITSFNELCDYDCMHSLLLPPIADL